MFPALKLTGVVSLTLSVSFIASPQQSAASDSRPSRLEVTECEGVNNCVNWTFINKGGKMRGIASWESGEEAGIRRIARALDEVHAEIEADVLTCLEITAGQGTSLGYKLEHLAAIIEKVKTPRRLGVCLDTAHLFAAGYDIRGRKYSKFRKSLESTIGIERVKVLHLNDSKKDLGSRVDRHEHIGLGKIGVEGFKPFVRDKAFKRIPKILETPKLKHPSGREWDEVNLEVLRGLM